MDQPVELIAAGTRVRAVSWAGVHTVIELPDLGVCFDMGICPESAIRHRRVFFTHGHVDHVGGIAHHCATRALRKLPPPEYVVPEDHLVGFEAVLSGFRLLDRSDLPATFVVARPGEAIDIGKGTRVVPFRAIHRVPTLGYAVTRTRRSLLPELVGKSNDEIVALRRAGLVIDVAHDVVEAAFCGDTTAGVIEREAAVRYARVLILEATFLDDLVSVRRARETGHVHLDELIERADLLQNEAIVLTHFSMRYSPAEVREILARRLPASLRDRVIPLLPAEPTGRTLR